MEVISAHDDCFIHLRRYYNTAEQTTADGDITGERALLVNVGALDRFERRLDAQSNISVPATFLSPHSSDKRNRRLLVEALGRDVSHIESARTCVLPRAVCTKILSRQKSGPGRYSTESVLGLPAATVTAS